MVKLTGERVYLAALERAHCRTLVEDFEYDFENPAEPLDICCSLEDAENWYDDIRRDIVLGKHIRFGVFLLSGTVIGDAALQNIDQKNRKCDIGLGFSKIEYRNRGYGAEAVMLALEYALTEATARRP
jgi:RimJ/RimL family protein N-acetyltransferase